MSLPVDPDFLGHAFRVALGITGRQQAAKYARAAGDRGRARVLALSRLGLADSVPSVLVVLLATTIAPDLGSTEPMLSAVLLALALVTVLATFLSLGLASSGRRLRVAIIVGTNAGLVAVLAAQLSALWAVLALLALRAALLGMGVAVQRPLLVDVAPPEARVRSLARWRAASVLGAAAAAGLAALAVGGPEWGWRGMLSLAGGAAAVIGLAVAFVDDPGVGGFERSRLARLVGDDAAPSNQLGRVGPAIDRASRTRAVRVSLSGYVGVGFAVVAPVLAIVGVVEGLGFTTMASFTGLGIAWLLAAVAVVMASDGLEARRRRSPGALAAAAPVLLVVAAVGLLIVGLADNAIGVLVGAGVVAAGAALAAAVLDATAMSAVEPVDRPAVSALTGLSFAGGGVLGLVWIEVVGGRSSTVTALLTLAVPVALCALVTSRLPRAADEALDGQLKDQLLRVEQHPPPETSQIPRWARSVDTSGVWRQALPAALMPPAGYVGGAVPPRALPAPAPASTPDQEVLAPAAAAAAYGLVASTSQDVDPLDPDVPIEALVQTSGAATAEVAPDPSSAAAAGVELVARLVADPGPTTVTPDSNGRLANGTPYGNGSTHGSTTNGHGPHVHLLPAGPGGDGHIDPLTAPMDQLGSYQVGTVWEYSLGSGPEDLVTGPNVLEARGVSHSYGSVQVLFDVSLRVEEGELVALLGPNGVGKTTLLRTLSGLAKPSAGQVLLGGADVTGLGASRRVPLGLSEIVGGQAVFGSMTIAENLRMYGFSLGRDKAAVEAGAEAAFEVFPRLADRREQLASTLSGGEQQMLGLSKALMLKPKVLLVDEFSLGLAPVVVGELMGLVRRLNAEGTAVLIVEQSVNVALSLVRRVYFMEKGRIVYEGLAEELRGRPDLVADLTLGGHADRLAQASR